MTDDILTADLHELERSEMAECIQRWRANDGTEWTTREKAEVRDRLIADIAVALAPLGARVEGPREFRQQTSANVIQVRLVTLKGFDMHPNTNEQAMEILRRIRSGETAASIAREKNIPAGRLYGLTGRKNWKCLKEAM